jgi:hypothetical protein
VHERPHLIARSRPTLCSARDDAATVAASREPSQPACRRLLTGAGQGPPFVPDQLAAAPLLRLPRISTR